MKKKLLTVIAIGLITVAFSAQAFAISTEYIVFVDDYAMLKIDGVLVASYDAYPAGWTRTGILDLAPGWHDIELVYKNRWGSNGLNLDQDNYDQIVPHDSFRSRDASGTYINGLRADYYDLSGNFLKTIYGEGPIQHGWVWAGTPGSSNIIPMYEGVSPALWGGIFNGWSRFEERLSGQILVGTLVSDTDNDGIDDATDNCPLIANADQADNDADGIGDVFDPDNDNDGSLDVSDNCPFVSNADQADHDGDGIGDVCDADNDNDTILNPDDNCPMTANADQQDTDGDGIGNACDTDLDGDGIGNLVDNCPAAANPLQEDNDSDGAGDACDADDDNDGIVGEADNCPLFANSDQADLDRDNIGDACDADIDGDGVENGVDNCVLVANLSQDDTDGDGMGDACDPDDDNDGVADGTDNCQFIANAGQADVDGDGIGNACDADLDGDGIENAADNCPMIANVNQADWNADGEGDACDTDVDGDGVPNSTDTDICHFTAIGEVVDPATGCSIGQLCPCDGPRGTTTAWKNHGQYVSCVAKSSENFLLQGLISQAEKDATVSGAAGSTCGVKK